MAYSFSQNKYDFDTQWCRFSLFVFLFLSDQIVYTDNINNLTGYACSVPKLMYNNNSTIGQIQLKNEGLFTRETPLKKPQATVHNSSDKNIWKAVFSVIVNYGPAVRVHNSRSVWVHMKRVSGQCCLLWCVIDFLE